MARDFQTASTLACVAGGSGYPRELRSRTRVQKAAQVTRRIGRSLVVSRAHPLPPATQAMSTLQRRCAEEIQKRSFIHTKTKTLFVSVKTENILKMELFEDDCGHDNHVIFVPELLKNKSKIADDCCVLKFLRRGVGGKHLMRFQSETSVFQLFWHSVDGASNI